MTGRNGFEAGGDEDDYVRKCMLCKHSYTRVNESDTLYCSLNICKFEEKRTNGNKQDRLQ